MNDVLNQNIQALQEAELALKEIDKVVSGVEFNIQDPAGATVAIRQMEEAVDL
ncbi:MAG: hypothetical protein PSY14_06380 [bacterium]|nr:hypothetical protein [bacterium]